MKEMLVDAVRGAGVPRELTRGDYAKLIAEAWGNHNVWKKPDLQQMSEDELRELYTKIKDIYASQ